MVASRMVAALAQLDKLRYYIAVPLGVAAGTWLGYRLGQPGTLAYDTALALAGLGAALWLGLSSPPPVRGDSRETHAGDTRVTR